MLGWLFRGRTHAHEPVPPFVYGSALTFQWDPDSEGWISALDELGPDARVFVAPKTVSEPPQSGLCELVLESRSRICDINDRALDYLAEHASGFISRTYGHRVLASSFASRGIEVLEYEGRQREYSLVFDPVFDRGAIWRVRMIHHDPVDWSFDD